MCVSPLNYNRAMNSADSNALKTKNTESNTFDQFYLEIKHGEIIFLFSPLYLVSFDLNRDIRK